MSFFMMNKFLESMMFSKFTFFIHSSTRRGHINRFIKWSLSCPHRSIFTHFINISFINIFFRDHPCIIVRSFSIRALINPKFKPSDKWSMLTEKSSLENFFNLVSTSGFINSTIFSGSKIESIILFLCSSDGILLIESRKLSFIERGHIFKRRNNFSFFSFFGRIYEIISSTLSSESHMMFIVFSSTIFR